MVFWLINLSHDFEIRKNIKTFKSNKAPRTRSALLDYLKNLIISFRIYYSIQVRVM